MDISVTGFDEFEGFSASGRESWDCAQVIWDRCRIGWMGFWKNIVKGWMCSWEWSTWELVNGSWIGRCIWIQRSILQNAIKNACISNLSNKYERSVARLQQHSTRILIFCTAAPESIAAKLRACLKVTVENRIGNGTYFYSRILFFKSSI
jgi:hypothetical protein